jgi:hypothetical protein
MSLDARCENCGMDIEKDYILFINGEELMFDSFECAVNFVAPRCAHCNTVIMGNGVHHSNDIFCSTFCSNERVHSPLIP